MQNAAVRSSFGASVPRDLGAEQPSWLRGLAWGLGAEGLPAPNPASPRRRTCGEWVSGTETPSKAAGPREPGQPSPGSPYGERSARDEKGMRCFLDQRRVGAVVSCLRRVSLWRRQLPEDRLGPSVRRGLGAELSSWLRGYGWRLSPEGLRAHNPASPRRRTRGEWVPDTGDPQQSSRAQGAGAAQPRFALWRAGVRGRKRLALLSRSEARWGCGLLPEESFPLQNAATRSSFGAVGATEPRR